MNLIIHSISENTAEWPNWLERQLVDLHLAELIAELDVIQGTHDDSIALSDICTSEELAQVFESGLAALDEAQVRKLMKHPFVLLALQEEVLVNGGNYWQQIPKSNELTNATASGFERLASELDQETPASTALQDPSQTAGGFLKGLMSMAAILLIGIALWTLRPPAGPTWGFDRSGLLTANISDVEYLDRISGAAEEWFNKRPEQQDAIIKRLKDFEHGCDTLISAPHPQLSSDDRDWLIEKCKLWKSKIVATRHDLEAGLITPMAARDNADKVVRKLQQVIQERITELG